MWYSNEETHYKSCLNKGIMMRVGHLSSRCQADRGLKQICSFIVSLASPVRQLRGMATDSN